MGQGTSRKYMITIWHHTFQIYQYRNGLIITLNLIIKCLNFITDISMSLSILL